MILLLLYIIIILYIYMHVSKVFINILLLYCASSWRLSSSDMSKRAESYLDGSFEPRNASLDSLYVLAQARMAATRLRSE
jgi:hypothetical protein